MAMICHDHVCRVHAMPPIMARTWGYAMVCRYAMLSPTFSDTGGHWWNVWCSSAPVVEVPLGSWHFFARICHPDLWGCAILHRQIHGGTLAGRFCFLIRNMETRMEPVEAIDSITLDSLIHFVSGEPLIRFLHVTTDVSQKVASWGIATDIFECCNYLGCRLLPDGLAGKLHYVPGRISQIDRNDRLHRKYKHFQRLNQALASACRRKICTFIFPMLSYACCILVWYIYMYIIRTDSH